MPKISVIIPAYNQSKLLKEAIKSVLSQSLSNLELFVIDDGSTDDTGSVVKQITNDRIKYFYKDNGGRCSARNLELVNANGQYIAYLDHDDIWPANYLETMVKHLDENPDYGLAYTHITVQFPDGRKRELGSSDRFKSGWLTKDFFYSSPCMLPSATCFRALICKDIVWDEQLKSASEDYDVFLRISTKTKFLFVPDTYVIKREQTPPPYRSQANLIHGARSLERFYYHFGGDKYVTEKVARCKISSRFRKTGRINEKSRNRCAAILLFKKALSYRWFDARLYIDLLRVWCQSKKHDKQPDWQMPEPLPSEITVTETNI